MMTPAHIRIRGKNLQELRKIKAKKERSGIFLDLSQLANQAIALGLKVAKEHTQ